MMRHLRKFGRITNTQCVTNVDGVCELGIYLNVQFFFEKIQKNLFWTKYRIFCIELRLRPSPPLITIISQRLRMLCWRAKIQSCSPSTQPLAASKQRVLSWAGHCTNSCRLLSVHLTMEFHRVTPIVLWISK